MPTRYARWLCLPFLLLTLACFAASDAYAKKVSIETKLGREGMLCVNCSNAITQELEYIDSLEQLVALKHQVSEALTQTAQQIRMAQQNIEQYANMVQNTARLPANLINQVSGEFTRLANLTSALRTQRGDMMALEQIYMNLFPEQSLFAELAGASPAMVEQANDHYEAEWDKWAANVEQATKATFQLSGLQLADLQQDPARFQSYMWMNCFPRRTGSKRRLWRAISLPRFMPWMPARFGNSWRRKCSRPWPPK